MRIIHKFQSGSFISLTRVAILTMIVAMPLLFVFGNAFSQQAPYLLMPGNHDLPKRLSLCGEPIPLENRYVWEMLDQEFTIAIHARAQVFLWLKRAGRYFPYIQQKLDEAGMPADLKYLAVAESALRPRIRSRKGAVGFWQFVPKTARRYKLKKNRTVDERRSLESSTEAALTYLRDLYGIFNSWTLALAAYNCGEERLEKEMKLQRIGDYYRLDLPLETERFIYRIAAIKLIMENPEQYGFYLPPDSVYVPAKYETVTIHTPKPIHITDFAEAIETEFKVIKELNHKLKGYYLPAGTYSLNVPAGKTTRVAKALKGFFENTPSESEEQDKNLYRVRAGDTLSHIAGKTGVSVDELKRLNDLAGSTVWVGQILRVTP